MDLSAAIITCRVKRRECIPLIRRFNLKTGDIVRGSTRVKKENEKFGALLYVTS